MSTPSVTFLMAARNAAHTIGPAIESVLRQDYAGEVQVVVVDDASSDGTADYVPRLTNVRVLRNSMQLGRSGSRNKGLSIIDTHLVAIQDADDVSLSHRLSSTVPLARGGRTVVGSQLIWQDPQRGPYEGARWPSTPAAAELALAAFRTPVPHPTMLLPLELIRSVGGYNEDLPVGEDLELMLRLSTAYPGLMFRNADLPSVVYSRSELDSLTYSFRSSYWRRQIALEYEAEASPRLAWVLHASERYARQRIRYLRRRVVNNFRGLA